MRDVFVVRSLVYELHVELGLVLDFVEPERSLWLIGSDLLAAPCDAVPGRAVVAGHSVSLHVALIVDFRVAGGLAIELWVGLRRGGLRAEVPSTAFLGWWWSGALAVKELRKQFVAVILHAGLVLVDFVSVHELAEKQRPLLLNQFYINLLLFIEACHFTRNCT